MNRNQMFWGLMLLLAGVLLLLNNLGILNVNIWGILWPLALITFGVNLLWGTVFRREESVTTVSPMAPGVSTSSAGADTLSFPLGNAREGEIEFNHGAGRLAIYPSADPNLLLSGTFTEGVKHEFSEVGQSARLKLGAPTDVIIGFPFSSGHGHEWNVNVNREIPLALKIHTGASENTLDLTELRVTRLRLETGASKTRVLMPVSAGYTEVRASSGAASIHISVPSGVAARIHYEGALSDIKVNESRFPRMGNIYESPDYAGAVNKADVHLEMGVGSITVD